MFKSMAMLCSALLARGNSYSTNINLTRGISLLAWWLLIFIWVVSNSACRGKAKVAEASRNLAATITKSLPTQNAGPQTSVPIEEQRVYLDASLSMKGFVNPVNHSTFDEFLDGIGDALPGCKLYRYGQKGATPPLKNSELIEPAQFGIELHQPGFYNLTYNPDDRLINELADENRPVLSLFITDGVYSEPRGGNAPPVVDAINRWIQNKNVFGILIFRSKFDGPFYSEKNRRFLPGEPVRADSRPFYAYVFSPTEQGFREIQSKLLRRFPEMQSILFSDSTVAPAIDFDERIKGTYSFKRPPEVNYHWQMFDDKLFAQKNPAPVGYRVTLLTSPDYPVSEFKVGLTAEYYRWEQGGFKKSNNGPPAGFSYETNFAGDKGQNAGEVKESGSKGVAPSPIVTNFPKDTSCDYGFYALTLTLTPVSSRQEIQEISTRDDSVREHANKTFRFFELVNALTDLHFKNHLAQKTSRTVFVTISNK